MIGGSGGNTLPKKPITLKVLSSPCRNVANGVAALTGTVKEKGSPNKPVGVEVRLHRDMDGAFVASTRSDPTTGVYIFKGLDPRYKYTTTAVDPLGNYRIVGADNLTAKVI